MTIQILIFVCLVYSILISSFLNYWSLCQCVQLHRLILRTSNPKNHVKILELWDLPLSRPLRWSTILHLYLVIATLWHWSVRWPPLLLILFVFRSFISNFVASFLLHPSMNFASFVDFYFQPCHKGWDLHHSSWSSSSSCNSKCYPMGSYWACTNPFVHRWFFVESLKPYRLLNIFFYFDYTNCLV